jgi:hypothetical protein
LQLLRDEEKGGEARVEREDVHDLRRTDGGKRNNFRSMSGSANGGALRERERVGTRGSGAARKPALIICNGVPVTIVKPSR